MKNMGLIYARKKLGLTQSQLANKIGMSVKTYQFYEEGRRIPRKENFFKLRDALGISIETFYNNGHGD